MPISQSGNIFPTNKGRSTILIMYILQLSFNSLIGECQQLFEHKLISMNTTACDQCIIYFPSSLKCNKTADWTNIGKSLAGKWVQ